MCIRDRLTIEETAEEEEAEGVFDGISFVITGSVEHFKNRKEIQEIIEQKGGKVTGSVTAKTNYLINNDTASSSSKNKKAKELGIPIISEQEFIAVSYTHLMRELRLRPQVLSRSMR